MLLSKLGVKIEAWTPREFSGDAGQLERSKLADQIAQLDFSDLDRCFAPTLLMTEKTNESWMGAFLESEFELMTELKALIKHVDLRLFPEIEKICFDYIGDMVSARNSTNLKEYVEMSKTDSMKFIKEEIKNWSKPVEVQGSNLFDQFVIFYKLLRIRTKLLVELFDLLQEAGVGNSLRA